MAKNLVNSKSKTLAIIYNNLYQITNHILIQNIMQVLTKLTTNYLQKISKISKTKYGNVEIEFVKDANFLSVEFAKTTTTIVGEIDKKLVYGQANLNTLKVLTDHLKKMYK